MNKGLNFTKIINQNARNGGSTAQKIRNPAEAGSKLLL